jgi:CheY-like chemotaxis protein
MNKEIRTTPMILLASASSLFAPLAGPLRQRGCRVEECVDGAKTLEVALRDAPDLLLVDTSLPVLGPDRLAALLRTNRRTEEAAIFFVGTEGEDVNGFRASTDRFVTRPFNVEQLLGEIRILFTARRRSSELAEARTEVEGDLQQISLPDLLQVFAMNQKDGVLALAHHNRKGYVYLSSGQPINARVGQANGVKAFFRLLQWEQGVFRFTPGQPQTENRITHTTDQLLLEGMRQNDEMRAQMSSFPAVTALLELAVPADRLPEGLRPATLELLRSLGERPQVGDIVEASPQSDYEVLQVLRSLLEKGLVREQAQSAATTNLTAFLSLAEIVAIKEFLGEGSSLAESLSAKLILLATNDDEVSAFLQALQGIDEFEPESDFFHGAGSLTLGDVGRLEITSAFHLRLFVLPAEALAAPLWRPFCHRLFGVLSLAGNDNLQEAERYFSQTMHMPVARSRDRNALGGVLPLRRNDRSGLRRLLQFFAAHFTGGDS